MLKELERLNENWDSEREERQKFQIWATREIAILQVKSGFYGAIGGLAVLLGAFIVKQLGLQ